MVDRDQSEFNMAISFLNRINTLFYDAQLAASNLDAHKWFGAILGLFREASTSMKVDEIDQFQKKFLEVYPEIMKGNRRRDDTGVQEIEYSLYVKLQSIELDIRRIMRDAGLETKLRQDPRSALRPGG